MRRTASALVLTLAAAGGSAVTAGPAGAAGFLCTGNSGSAAPQLTLAEPGTFLGGAARPRGALEAGVFGATLVDRGRGYGGLTIRIGPRTVRVALPASADPGPSVPCPSPPLQLTSSTPNGSGGGSEIHVPAVDLPPGSYAVSVEIASNGSPQLRALAFTGTYVVSAGPGWRVRQTTAARSKGRVRAAARISLPTGMVGAEAATSLAASRVRLDVRRGSRWRPLTTSKISSAGRASLQVRSARVPSRARTRLTLLRGTEVLARSTPRRAPR